MNDLERPAAIGQDATRVGVINADKFETLAATIHGYGVEIQERRERETRVLSERAEETEEVLAGAVETESEVSSNGHVYAPTIVPCGDRWCAACTTSTTGPPFSRNMRAGEAYEDEGRIPTRTIKTLRPDGTEGERLESCTTFDNTYDAEIAIGGERSAKAIGDGITSKDEYLGAPITWLMKSSVEPDRRGSGSKGRKHSTTRVPDPAAYLPPMREAAA